jgi:IclR family transcriptional regulator, mhp operon transcriptional activator
MFASGLAKSYPKATRFHFVKRAAKLVKTVRSVTRAMQVLEALDQPLDLHALHQRTGLDRATLLRMLRTLMQDGYVLRSLSSGHYAPTPRLARLGAGAGADSYFTDRAGETLDRLCRDLLWPSDIGVPRDGAIMIVETSRSLSPFITNPRVLGRPISMLHAAMGQAYLAFSAPDERDASVERLIERNLEGFPVERRQIDRVIEETRARGYGVRLPGYAAFPDSVGDKLRAIAVPVMVVGYAEAALSLVWIATFATVEEMAERNLDRLRQAADELAQQF